MSDNLPNSAEEEQPVASTPAADDGAGDLTEKDLSDVAGGMFTLSGWDQKKPPKV